MIHIDNSSAHSFCIQIDEVRISASYKAFGGRQAVEQLVSDGLIDMVNTAITIIRDMLPVSCLHPYFDTVGIDNGLTILSIIDREAVIAYWRAVAAACRTVGGCAFRRVLQAVTGSKATLAHSQAEIVRDLKSICAAEAPYGDITILGMAPIASGEGITVSFDHADNNTYHFSVNGVDVIACSSRTGELSSAEAVLTAAIQIRDTVFADEDLHPLTARYGGSFVLRILAAVCPEQGIQYFADQAMRLARSTGTIIGRHMLEGYHYAYGDTELAKYTDQILGSIEALDLTEHVDNDGEIANGKMSWTLWYLDGSKYRYRSFDFSQIGNYQLANEIRRFLADLYRGGTTVLQLARYYMLLRDAINALGKIPLSTILDAKIDHAEAIKAGYFRDAGSSPRAVAEKVLETLSILGRMYAWRWADSGQTAACDNPFWQVTVRNAHAYQHHVIPAAKDAIRRVRDNADHVPEAVAIIIDLITATYLRANDACLLRLRDLRVIDGNTHLQIITGKTQMPYHCILPDELARHIINYADKTAELRAQLGDDDYIFIYQRSDRREGSNARPEIVNAGKIRYYTQQIGEPTVTARSIRAAGGVNDYLHGKSDVERAKQLGNTPRIADQHYTTISSRSAMREKAELMHKHYESIFCGVLGDQPQRRTDTPRNSPLWGSCDNPQSCPNRNICSRCTCCQEATL